METGIGPKIVPIPTAACPSVEGPFDHDEHERTLRRCSGMVQTARQESNRSSFCSAISWGFGSTSLCPSHWASIICLFFSCCPSTIRRRVPSIIINSINCQTGNVSSQHVVRKTRKRFPVRANGNSSSAVIRIMHSFWVGTSL